jgi:hypothetical protein
LAEVIREMRETARKAAEQVRLWSDEAREALKEMRATAQQRGEVSRIRLKVFWHLTPLCFRH